MPGVRVVEAPAEALPFEDGSFGAAFAQLVVHFMSDPAAGISEMRRVTRPGGVVAVNVWDFQNQRAPQSLFFRALREVMPDVDDEVARAGARRGRSRRPADRCRMRATSSSPSWRSRSSSRHSRTGGSRTRSEWARPAPSSRASTRRPQDAVRRRCEELLPQGAFRIEAVAWAAKGRA